MPGIVASAVPDETDGFKTLNPALPAGLLSSAPGGASCGILAAWPSGPESHFETTVVWLIANCYLLIASFQLRPYRHVLQKSGQHRLAFIAYRSCNDHSVRLNSAQLAWLQIGDDHHLAPD